MNQRKKTFLLDYEKEKELAKLREILLTYPEETVNKFCNDIELRYLPDDGTISTPLRKNQIVKMTPRKGVFGTDVDFIRRFEKSIFGDNFICFHEWKVNNGSNSFDKYKDCVDSNQFKTHDFIINNFNSVCCIVFSMYRSDKFSLTDEDLIIHGILFKEKNSIKVDVIHSYDGLSVKQFEDILEGKTITLSLSKDFHFYHGTLIPYGCKDKDIIDRPGGIRISPVYIKKTFGITMKGKDVISSKFVNNTYELEDLINGKDYPIGYLEYLKPMTICQTFTDLQELISNAVYKKTNRRYDYGIYVEFNKKAYDLNLRFSANNGTFGIFDENNKAIFLAAVKERIIELFNKEHRYKLEIIE